MKENKKKGMGIFFAAIMAISVFLMLVTPTSAVIGVPPEPEELWR